MKKTSWYEIQRWECCAMPGGWLTYRRFTSLKTARAEFVSLTTEKPCSTPPTTDPLRLVALSEQVIAQKGKPK